MFDRFYRSENAINSPITGSGLGLYLTKYFVELHNGSISVESKRSDKGQHLRSGCQWTVKLIKEKPMYKVLVVDDDASLRLSVKSTLLATERFEIDEAYDGLDAVDKVKTTTLTWSF